MDNVVLIGMPGAGKSTIGVVLAKMLGYSFMDTDLLIQEQTGKLLQTSVDELGVDGFVELEGNILATVSASRNIIATGGSAVYTERAMHNLRDLGHIVYIELSYEEINNRINNISTRGLALAKTKTLKDLYDERIPLYKKHADIVVNCENTTIETAALRILEQLQK